MITTKDIGQFLDESNYGKQSFCDIAKNHDSIKSSIEAYDYDEIKKDLAGDKCESADALYLKRHIYFLEFKTGFASEKADVNINTHKENLKLKIRLKAYESLALLEKVIFSKIGDGIQAENVQKVYVAVVDAKKVPMEAYSDVLKARMAADDNTFRQTFFKNTLLIYGKEVKGGKKLFYDRVDVWYDFEFDRKIERLA